MRGPKKTKTVRVTYRTYCRKCNGSGDMFCPSCGGDGYDYYGGQCSRCYGMGTVTCSDCGGSGYTEYEDNEEVEVND